MKEPKFYQIGPNVGAIIKEFPKWMYHDTEDPVLVQNETEEEALGAGWLDAFARADALKVDLAPVDQEVEDALDIPVTRPAKKVR